MNSKKMNTAQLREHNKNLIRYALKNIESGTKKIISDMTGLSVATCNNLLKILLKSGEIIELESTPSTGGRPSRQFKYNASFKTLAQIILTKENEEYAITARCCDLIGNEMYKTKEIYPILSVSEISSILEILIKKFPNLSHVSIGVPGVVYQDSIGLCSIKGLENSTLIADLKQRFDLVFYIENDVNATTLGFYENDNYEKNSTFSYIYFPKNFSPGAGIIANGSIIKGNTYFAGEIAYLPLGVTKTDQTKIHLNQSQFTDYVTRIIITINCIINPKIIALSGESFSQESFENIREQLVQSTPNEHIPEIILVEDIDKHYFKGLEKIIMKNI